MHRIHSHCFVRILQAAAVFGFRFHLPVRITVVINARLRLLQAGEKAAFPAIIPPNL